MNHSNILARLRLQLDEVRCGRADSAGLVTALRAEPGLLATLPQPFRIALEDMATRLESARLFTEDSCSFSQRELIDALAEWIGHADARLGASVPAN